MGVWRLPGARTCWCRGLCSVQMSIVVIQHCLWRLYLQVAKQEGEYLANALVSGQFDEQQNKFKLPEKAGPFK